jgi:hypothetical protein
MSKIVYDISVQIYLHGHTTAIEMYFEDITCEGVYWIKMIQARF